MPEFPTISQGVGTLGSDLDIGHAGKAFRRLDGQAVWAAREPFRYLDV